MHGRGLNKVMLIGWLDGDPELRRTPGGRAVASFSVGAPRMWQTVEGQTHEETDWFNVVAWGGLAEMCQRELVGGQRVYVEGRLQTRGWADADGRRHYRTEVVAQEILVLTDPYLSRE